MNKRYQRVLGMEQLESRQLMAGDIMASVVRGSLTIREMPGQIGQANEVWIQGLGNNQVRVTTTPGGTSKVNGAAYQDFTVTGALSVSLGGGNDRLQIGSDSALKAVLVPERPLAPEAAFAPEAAVAPKFTSVTINTASKVRGGADADQVLIYGLTTSGAVRITTGNDADLVHIGGNRGEGDVAIGSGTGADDLTIRTGKGADQVNLSSGKYHRHVDIQTYDVATENEADSVRFDRGTTVGLDVKVRTGDGADTINISDNTKYSSGGEGLSVGGALDFDSGAGNDTLFLKNFRVGKQPFGSTTSFSQNSFEIHTGKGADSLTIMNDLGFGTVTGDVYVQMYGSINEIDVDTVIVGGLRANGDMHFWLGGGDDRLSLANAISFRDMDLSADGGIDHLEVLNCTAVENFFAGLGKEDDTLRIDHLRVASGYTTLRGGIGNDTLTTSNMQLAHAAVMSEWETIL